MTLVHKVESVAALVPVITPVVLTGKNVLNTSTVNKSSNLNHYFNHYICISFHQSIVHDSMRQTSKVLKLNFISSRRTDNSVMSEVLSNQLLITFIWLLLTFFQVFFYKRYQFLGKVRFDLNKEISELVVEALQKRVFLLKKFISWFLSVVITKHKKRTFIFKKKE